MFFSNASFTQRYNEKLDKNLIDVSSNNNLNKVFKKGITSGKLLTTIINNIQLEKLISNTRKTSAQNLHCTLSIDDGTSEQNSTELDEESKDIHLAQQLTTDMINKVISRLLYDYIKIS
ncbi:unnamed protein product [Heterobilharzia americana]|nr:unnamed protein product [Heterobilharzia americana]